MAKIRSVKKLRGGQIEVVTATKEVYFIKEGKKVVVEQFNKKVKNPDLAYIRGDIYSKKNLLKNKTVGRLIGSRSRKRVVKLLK